MFGSALAALMTGFIIGSAARYALPGPDGAETGVSVYRICASTVDTSAPSRAAALDAEPLDEVTRPHNYEAQPSTF